MINYNLGHRQHCNITANVKQYRQAILQVCIVGGRFILCKKIKIIIKIRGSVQIFRTVSPRTSDADFLQTFCI